MASDEDVITPCTTMCEIEPGAGVCKGCGRTMSEIFRWPTMTDEERRAVMEDLATRKRERR